MEKITPGAQKPVLLGTELDGLTKFNRQENLNQHRMNMTEKCVMKIDLHDPFYVLMVNVKAKMNMSEGMIISLEDILKDPIYIVLEPEDEETVTIVEKYLP